jgi:hypothetical protein
LPVPSQSFGGAHRGSVCARVFIGVRSTGSICPSKVLIETGCVHVDRLRRCHRGRVYPRAFIDVSVYSICMDVCDVLGFKNVLTSE